ncbi:amino acid adenylation domain-containing protein [Streptomyces sp. MUM 136J]|uniref:amino acid adenylation domain-containing protein n=1 Tax=Streptomyces sp. MUM 136J TaxID=2791992 RepID=UPI0023D94BE9|nr:amino acid adenylation domain-containing protein [Streptomyces sp. MUM 136J]MCH0571632.1 amino acid adenylation domain-containing protein [Streptomyces sp. MUM 136J]
MTLAPIGDTTAAPTDTGPRHGAADRGLPLTAAQSGMWYLQALDPDSPALNTAQCLEIHGPLDTTLFTRAVRQVTDEADALRVRVADLADGPRQFPCRWPDPPLEVRDLRGRPDADRQAEAWMDADLAVPFDLAAGPLFRYVLFRTGEQRWLYYQRIHHLVMDGYGYMLLMRRTAEVYTALAEGRPPAPRPFGTLDRLLAQDAEYRAGDARAADAAHWRELLADRPEAPLLAGRSALPSRSFHRRSAHLDGQEAARLRELAAGLRATWPEVLIAAQALYTSRATARRDVVLGLPMMSRMGSDALRIPGMVMNVLPLRLAVDPEATFAELVRQVVLAVRAVRRHQRYRYEDIRRDLGLLGAGRALLGPLVNVMPFDFGADFAGSPALARSLSSGPVEDLTVNVYDLGGERGLRIDHDANPALHEDAEVALHQDRFLSLLTRLTRTDPHLPTAVHGVALPAERAQLLDALDDTTRELPGTTLIGPIEAQANRTPDAPALAFGDSVLSYAELNGRANRLARHLISLGARPGTVVAVAVPRSAELPVALLGVLKSGAAYLPLDPDYPDERLAHMLADAAPVCAVTDRAGRLPETTRTPLAVLDGLDLDGYLPTNPARALTPSHPAYVIYTSGSTGRPKGVVVPHAAIDNRLRWMQGTYRLTPGERVLQKTPSSFDVSVWEFFWPLRVGATLVVAEPGGHRDPAYLARLIREQAVTTCHFVPSMLQMFLADPAVAGGGVPSDSAQGGLGGLRRVFCSGEALPRDTAHTFARVLPGVELHNLYGPTEAAVDVTHHACRPEHDGPVPIGAPVWNTRLYVLDAALQLCPPGVPGELYLAGAQLADGYLGRAELTAARFVADPFGPPGSRMYRTGDLARWTPEGEVEYLGRTDHQVKLRGQRIEPGEIEAALSARDGVDGAVVLVREDRPGDQRLIGYITGDADPAAVRRALTGTLPEHMVPAAVVRLDSFPLSPNGKLDRRALPAPVFASASRRPATEREAATARLFAEVLGLEETGPDDAFFDLGGTSLLAVHLVARVREEFGVELTVGSLFAAPTPAALAARIDEAGPASRDALGTVLPLRAEGDRPPLFAFHPAGGIAWCYAGLPARLGPRQPVYGVQAPGLLDPAPLPDTLEETAALYVRHIRRVRPSGPYRLLGWSVGGALAHTVAVLLQEAGERVDLLALLDAFPAEQWRDRPAPEEGDALTAVLRMAGLERRDERSRGDVVASLSRAGSPLAGLPGRTLSRIVDIVPHNARLMREHHHRRYDGDMVFFTAAAPRKEDWLTYEAWRPHAGGRIVNVDLDCTHPRMTQDRQLDTVGAVLAARLREIDA